MIYVWYENRDNLLILKNIEKWKKSTILFPKMLSGKDTFIASYTAPTQSSENFSTLFTVVILISTAIIMMESVPKLDKRFHYTFIIMEWIISIFFLRNIFRGLPY
jgi:hypothetical protein